LSGIGLRRATTREHLSAFDGHIVACSGVLGALPRYCRLARWGKRSRRTGRSAIVHASGCDGAPPSLHYLAWNDRQIDGGYGIRSGRVGFPRRSWLHVIDTIGIVHAMILRLQALVLPFKVLIGSAH
jgi:hypothetical protein